MNVQATSSFKEFVGRRIREIRHSQGMSQGELARRLGKAQTVISLYESGSREMGIEELPRIASALEVQMSFLIGESPAEEELDLAEEILSESVKIAARVTIIRLIIFHYQLLMVFRREFPHNDSLTSLLLEIPITYRHLRNETMDKVKKHVELLSRFHKQHFDQLGDRLHSHAEQMGYIEQIQRELPLELRDALKSIRPDEDQ
jgi:transcriptional regulator with XRE-family HTH domain